MQTLPTWLKKTPKLPKLPKLIKQINLPKKQNLPNNCSTMKMSQDYLNWPIMKNRVNWKRCSMDSWMLTQTKKKHLITRLPDHLRSWTSAQAAISSRWYRILMPKIVQIARFRLIFQLCVRAKWNRNALRSKQGHNSAPSASPSASQMLRIFFFKVDAFLKLFFSKLTLFWSYCFQSWRFFEAIF